MGRSRRKYDQESKNFETSAGAAWLNIELGVKVLLNTNSAFVDAFIKIYDFVFRLQSTCIAFKTMQSTKNSRQCTYSQKAQQKAEKKTGKSTGK